LALDIDGVEATDEVYQDVMNTLGDLLEQNLGNFFVGRVLRKVYWDEKLLGFGIDIANINTTLVGEVNPIALLKRGLAWYSRTRSCPG
jgi:hypothetical protein